MDDDTDRRLGGWLGLVFAVLAGLYFLNGLVTGDVIGPQFGFQEMEFPRTNTRGEDIEYWYHMAFALFVMVGGVIAWMRRD